jgi:hypothetical protein
MRRRNAGVSLAQSVAQSHTARMTEKEIMLETDGCSQEEIAERIEFMLQGKRGFDQLDRGEGIPHDEVKNN